MDFSDIIAGRPKEVGLQVLAAVCGGVRDREHLAYVDVSDNAMGPDGVDACRPAIEGKQELRALFMCNDGLSEAAMETVRVRYFFFFSVVCRECSITAVLYWCVVLR